MGRIGLVTAALMVTLGIAASNAFAQGTPADPASTFADNCAACHQPDGKGIEGAFPALAGDRFVLGDPAPAIHVVLEGRGGMPQFGALSDAQIAAALSYVRSSWGNRAAAVSPDVVGRLRTGTATPKHTKTINAH